MKKTMMKLLSVVMALMMLFGSFSTVISAADVHEHTKGTKLETIAPTCNAVGYTMYICAGCGETWATDIVPIDASAHGKETQAVDKVEPTCFDDGHEAGEICVLCGEYVKGGATITAPGAHDFKWVLSVGTCNDEENISYECVRCGEDGGRPDSPIWLGTNPDGHEFAYVITKYPSCELKYNANSTQKYFTVDAEGVKSEEKYDLTTKDGEASYKCMDPECDVEYTGIIVKWTNHEDHNLVHKTNGKIDSCTTFAAEWDECTVCKAAFNYVKTDVINGHNHVRVSLERAQELGYVSNYIPGTCYQAGYEVKECTNRVEGVVCGDFKYETYNQTSHDMKYTCPLCEAAGTECSDCTHANRTYQCEYYGQSNGSVGCLEKTAATHEEHKWSTEQYFEYTYVDINGQTKTVVMTHDASVAKYCKTVYLYKKCTNDNCTVTSDLETLVGGAGGKHLSAGDERVNLAGVTAPTCTMDGWIYSNCNACGSNNEKIVGAAAEKYIAEKLAADPTNAALLAVKDTNFEKLGHNTLANGEVIVETVLPTCVADGATAVIICGRENRDGKCQHVLQESTPIAKDPENHAGTQTLIGDEVPGTCQNKELAYYHCGSCDAYYAVEGDYDYLNHAQILYKNLGRDGFKIESTTAGNVTVPAKTETCTEDGNVLYTCCKFCAVVTGADYNKDGVISEYTADLELQRFYRTENYVMPSVVVKGGHLFGEVEAVKETCTTDGLNAHKTPCTRVNGGVVCGAIPENTKQVIPAHGDKYAVYFTAVGATCVNPGVNAGRYCSECNTWNGTALTIDKVVVAQAVIDAEIAKLENPLDANGYPVAQTLTYVKAGMPWYVAPVSHNMVDRDAADLVDVTVVKGDCRQETFGDSYCTYCVAAAMADLDTDERPGREVPAGSWYLTDLVLALDHTYPEAVFEDDVTNGVVKNVIEEIYDDCTTDDIYYVECLTCATEKKVVKVDEAKGHYYVVDGKEVIAETSCDEYEKHIGHICAECNGIFGDIAGYTQIPMTHDICYLVEYDSCEDYGVAGWVCADCDLYFADDSDPTAAPMTFEEALLADYITLLDPKGHTFTHFKTDANGNLVGFLPATHTAEGYVTRVCADCGDVRETLEKLVPELNISLEAAPDAVAAGDEFTLDVTLKGTDYQFNALQVEMTYAKEKIEFLAKSFEETAPAGVKVEVNEADGKIVFMIYSLDGVDIAANVPTTYHIPFRAIANFDETDVATLTYAIAYNSDEEPIDNSVYGNLILGEAATLASVVTGELNGFYGIDVGDGLVIMDLIYAEAYDSAADMDKDGDVDIYDLAILNKIIATDGSDDSYNKCIKEELKNSGVSYKKISRI